MNTKQATILGLEACGFVEVVGRSRKYRVFTKLRPGIPSETWLVGINGALRRIPASRNAIKDSISHTGCVRHKAFEYCGRVKDRQPDLPVEKFQELWSSVRSGDINPSEEN